MQPLFQILIPIGLFLVFAVLVVGIVNLVRTGGGARSTSNRLMRLRVLVQFGVVIVLIGMLWVARSGA